MNQKSSICCHSNRLHKLRKNIGESQASYHTFTLLNASQRLFLKVNFSEGTYLDYKTMFSTFPPLVARKKDAVH